MNFKDSLFPEQIILSRVPNSFHQEVDVKKDKIKMKELVQQIETSSQKLETILDMAQRFKERKEYLIFLVNHLHQIDEIQIQYYITQLVYLNIKSPSEELEEFLLFKCQQSISLYLKIKMTYEAFTNDNFINQKIEEAMVNNTTDFLDKINRCNYVISMNLFINNLTYLSQLLKKFQENDTLLQLKKYLIKANQALENYRQSDIRYQQGIIMPFYTENPKSNMVVRIIDSESQVYITKKRVPYKIILETVDMNEIKIRKYSINLGTNHEILEDFLEKVDGKLRSNAFLGIQRNLKKTTSVEYKRQKERIRYRSLTNLQTSNSKRFVVKKQEQDNQNFVQAKFNINNPFQFDWQNKLEAIKKTSPYSHYKSYCVRSLIVKGGDDLRQELILMQMLQKIKKIFDSEGTGLYIKTYEVIVASVDSGFLEFCEDTLSLHQIKKQFPKKSLREIYEFIFEEEFEEAQKNFIESLAGYSIAQYLFQIKDRHNGNILMNKKGYIIHIDFGFILGITPGNLNFESVPFKLTREYVDLMDGKDSEMFTYFKSMIFKGIASLQPYAEEFITLLNIMRIESDLPCFYKFDVNQFRQRFEPDASFEQIMDHVERLVGESIESSRSVMYDDYQKLTNGILP